MSCSLRSYYLDNRLDGREAEQFEAHLDTCAACAAAVSEWESIEALLRDWGDERTHAADTGRKSRELAEVIAIRSTERARTRRYRNALVAAGLLLFL